MSNYFSSPSLIQYERVATYTLASMYACLLLVSSVQLGLTLSREQKSWWTPTSQKLTLTAVVVTCAMRAAFFGVLSDLYRPSAKLFDVFWSQPAVFLWTAYTIIIFHWASVHFQAVDGNDRRVKRTLKFVAAANALLYGAQFALYIILFEVDQTDEVFAFAEPILLAVAFLLSSLFVAFFGCSLVCSGRQAKGRSALVVSVLTLSFTARAFVNPFWHTQIVAKLDGASFFVFLVFFYTLVEVAPLTVVLALAARVPRRSVVPERAGLFFQTGQFDIQEAQDDAGVLDDEDGFYRDEQSQASFANLGTADLLRSADRLRESLAASYSSGSFQRDAQLFGRLQRRDDDDEDGGAENKVPLQR